MVLNLPVMFSADTKNQEQKNPKKNQTVCRTVKNGKYKVSR